MNPTSVAVLKYWALPNLPGTPNTRTNNYIVNAGTGTDNDQWGIRGDYNMSDKQRMFARFTRWNWHGLPTDPMRVGRRQHPRHRDRPGRGCRYLYTFANDDSGCAPGVPAQLLSVPRTAEWHRLHHHWLARVPESTQISPRQLPAMVVTGLTNSASNGQFIEAVTDSELISGSITKILGRHTIKTGAEFRRLPNSYGQTGGSGNNQLTFTTAFTALNPLAPGSTGIAFASYMLGMGNGGQMVSVGLLAGTQKYAGAYVGDTFQVSKKLTLNYGVRWELPGYWTERYDRLTVFQPGAQNPVLASAGLKYKR